MKDHKKSDTPFTVKIPETYPNNEVSATSPESDESDSMVNADQVPIQRLIDDTYDGIAILEENGTIRYESPCVEQILGYKPEELLGKSVYDFLHPEDVGVVKKILKRIVQENRRQEPLHFRFRDRTGRWRVLEARGQAFLDDPAMSGVVVNIRDIHRHKILENRHQFEQLLTGISTDFINMPVEAIDRGIDQAIRKIASFARMKGGAVFTLLQNPPRLVVTHEWRSDSRKPIILLFHEVTPEKFRYFWQQLQRLETIIVHRTEDLPPTARRERKWIKSTGLFPMLFIPMTAHGKLYGALTFYGTTGKQTEWSEEFINLLKSVPSIFANALERKAVEEIHLESEKKLLSISATAQDAIIMVDNEGKITFWNTAAEKIFGYTRQEAIHKNLHHLVLPRTYLEAFRRGFDHFKKTGQGPLIGRTIEITLCKKDGTKTPAELSLSAIKIKGKWNAIGIIRDITERKQVERKLVVQAQQQAAVARLGQRALAGIELSVLMKEAVELVARTLDVEYCKVLELLPEGKHCRMRAGVGWRKGLVGKATITAGPDTQVGYTLSSKSPVIIEDLSTETRFECPSLLKDHGVMSGMSVIIAGHERPFGILGAHTTRRRKFSKDDVNFLQAVANVLADAIERKRAEEALKKSEEHYRAVVEDQTELICRFKPDGTITFVNNAFARYWGKSPEELMGINFQTLLPTSMRRGVRKHFDLFSPEDPVRLVELEVITTEGEIRWQQWSVRAFFDDQGNLTEFQSAGQDITERKKTLEELKKLSSAVQESADSVVITNKHGIIEYVNPAFEKLSGYKSDEVIGKTLRVLKSGVHEKKFYKKLWETILSGKVFRAEFINRKKDGTLYFQEETITPILDSDGNVTHFVSTGRDVTERKKTVEKIREQAALLDISRDAIMVQTMDHQIIFWNKGAERLYGWRSEEVLNRSALKLLYKEKTQELKEARKEVLEKGEWSGELHQTTKTGKDIVVDSRWTLVRSDEGEATSILIVNSDITEKKILERQFLRAQRMESIGTLAGGIAHDLKNILSPILMSVELLQTQFTDEKVQRILKTIESSVLRGADMVKQVLTFARGVEGEHILLQPKHLIKEIEKIIIETFPKSITVKTRVPKDLWTIEGDATQLHQVLLNLCVNARDAMPEGGHIQISAENVVLDKEYSSMHVGAQSGPYVVISVADTGTGIPEEIIDKIFEPFFTTKDVGKGTGLGLSTVTAIVKSHNGFVDVKSELNKGSTFRIYLPAHGTSKARVWGERKAALPSGNGEWVLVVDDEISICEITKETLETYGYRVLTAGDGAEAVALFARHRDQIAVVITDMRMPIMDGIATIRALQHIKPDVNIIAISGFTSDKKIVDFARKRGKAFLEKPFTAEKLLRTIHKAINGELN